MESESPAQLPVVQETQAQPPPSSQPVATAPGQPIMYQMAPGQQQPVSIQLPPGQPATTPEGQPIQYYYVPVSQAVQPGQQGQPVFGQGTPGQPVQSGQPVHIQGTARQPVQPGQPVHIQGAPGQPVQPGQPVYIQAAPGQPVQPHQLAGQGGFDLIIDTAFLKSPPCFIKIVEFVSSAVSYYSSF